MKCLISFIQFVVLFVFIPSLNAQYLKFVDPKQQWRSGSGLITYAEYIVRVEQNFAHCDLYLTYTANIPNFTNPSDTFEVIHYFNLPKHSLVTDSWLWVDSVIMKADILERRYAFNIYEGIVKRRQDPSILYKNSETQYELRIFPIVNKKSRRIKLSFTIPLNRLKDNLTLPIPVGLIAASYTQPNIVLKIKYDESYQKISTTNLSFNAANDNFLGSHYKTTISPSIYNKSQELTVNFQLKENQIIFESQQTADNGLKSYYQVSINPLSAFGLQQGEARNVVIVIDNETITSSISKQDFISNVKKFTTNTLYPTDSLQIIYTNNKANKLFNDFVIFSPITTNNLLNNITLGDISLLYNGLYDAYDLLKNKTNPVLVVFSSGVSFANISVASSTKDNLYNTFKTIPKSFFINYNNEKVPYYYFHPEFYRGNTLFYKIMASNSGGSYASVNEGNTTNISPEDALQKISEDFGEYNLSDFEMEVRIKSSDGGFSYDNTNFTNKRTGFAQTGLLVGKPPYTIEGVFFNKSDVITKKIVIKESDTNQGYNNAAQIHAGLNIIKFENENLKAKEFQILNLSLENRVLSRFTAFLALEPSLKTPCYQCKDESNTPTPTNQTQYGYILKVFPNPFSDVLNIEIQGVIHEKVENLEIFDVMGRKFEAEYEINNKDATIYITIKGNNLKDGIYFVKVKLGNKILSFKIVKRS